MRPVAVVHERAGWLMSLFDRLPHTKTNPCEGRLRRMANMEQRPASLQARPRALLPGPGAFRERLDRTGRTSRCNRRASPEATMTAFAATRHRGLSWSRACAREGLSHWTPRASSMGSCTPRRRLKAVRRRASCTSQTQASHQAADFPGDLGRVVRNMSPPRSFKRPGAR